MEAPITVNICDHRFLEYEIVRQNPHVHVMRLQFKQIREMAVFDPVTKSLSM